MALLYLTYRQHCAHVERRCGRGGVYAHGAHAVKCGADDAGDCQAVRCMHIDGGRLQEGKALVGDGHVAIVALWVW